jgi:hypothetical protein
MTFSLWDSISYNIAQYNNKDLEGMSRILWAKGKERRGRKGRRK